MPWIAAAAATTWVVAKDGTGDFGQIQLAIDVSRAGDIIEVGPGTYVGALDLRNRPISIVGRDGSAATVVDGGGAAVALTIRGADVTISGLSFVNEGAGIVTRDRSEVELRDVVFTSLSPAFAMDNGAASFDDCSFVDSAGELGGAIHAEAGEVSITSSQFSGSRADRGADVYLGPSVRLSAHEVSFVGGEAKADGGSLYVSPGAAAVVSNSVFEGAVADRGGAVALRAASLSVSGTSFRGSTSRLGGAVWAEGSTVVTVAVSFTAGVATGGAGVYLSGGSLDDLGSGFDAGLADDAAGLYAEDALVTLSGTTFSSGTALATGGVYLSRPELGSSLANVTVTDHAGDVGALRVAGGSSVAVDGLRVEGDAGGTASVFVEGEVVATGLDLENVGTGAALMVDGTLDAHGARIRADSTAVWARGTVRLGLADVRATTALWVDGGSLVASTLLSRGGDVRLTGNATAELAHATLVGGAVAVDGGALLGHSLVVEGEVVGNASLAYSDTLHALAPGDGNVSADPRFVEPGGDPETADLRLLRGSPCVDAGHPDDRDPDGSRADMGAYGGPDAPVSDADGDGHDSASDCVDTDPGIFPGAADVPGDGVDQDCDGADAPAPLDTGTPSTPGPEEASGDTNCACGTGSQPALFALLTGVGWALSRWTSRRR